MTLVIGKPLTLAKAFTWNETVWNPSMITTSLWLDAADNSTVFSDAGSTQAVAGTSTVQQWKDKSGNNLHFSQATSGDRPSYLAAQQNNRNTISNASNDWLELGSSNLLKNVAGATAAVVCSYPVNGTYTVANVPILGISSSSTGLSRFSMTVTANVGSIQDSVAFIGRRLDADSAIFQTTSTTRTSRLGSFFMQIASINYATAIANNWTNGIQDLTNSTFGTTGNTSNTDSSGTGIFRLVGATNGTTNNTSIAEIVVIHETLSTVNRQKLEGYLAHKWGLTANLPSDHPYKTVGPTP